MPTQQFLPFGIGSTTALPLQADYLAATWRTNGHAAGILTKEKLNKTLRQTSVVASALMDAVTAITGGDALDNGDVAAIAALVQTAVSVKQPLQIDAVFPTGSLGRFIQLIFQRTAAEIAAGVTPACFWYGPGDIRRYGGLGDDSSDNATAFAAMFAQFGAEGGSVCRLGKGTFRTTASFVRTTRLTMIGMGRFQTVILQVSPPSDLPFLNFNGTAEAPIMHNKIRGINFMSTNSAGKALQLTYAPHGDYEDLYFYELWRGVSATYAYNSHFKDCKVYNVQYEVYQLVDECNNMLWTSCMFRSLLGDALSVIGNTAGLTFVAPNIEGIMTVGKVGLRFAPATGAKVVGIDIGGGAYIEKCAGGALACDGADADSVQALKITSAQFYGGHDAFFDSVSGMAQYAILLHNVNGFCIETNGFTDWQTAAIFADDATVRNGTVRNNTTYGTVPVPALCNGGNRMGPSVELTNNFAGRKVEYADAMPTTGSYTQGDYVRNRIPTKDAITNMTLLGWIRLTTGAAHVAGVDWSLEYVSHTSPAV